jgi:ribonuclease HI
MTQWMRGWIAKGWKTAAGKPVKNKELWVRLKELNDAVKAEWRWVKGHDGDPMNERCDELVAIERARFS